MQRKDHDAELLRDFVFGIEDGLVSTLGIVTGVAAALATNNIIIIAGLANMIAAGLSMAAGTYLSAKSQLEFYARGKRRKNIRKTPLEGAVVIFFSFALGATFPILPYFFTTSLAGIPYSALATAVALFFFGALKTRYTHVNWVKSGLEMMCIGLSVGAVGYLIGSLV